MVCLHLSPNLGVGKKKRVMVMELTKWDDVMDMISVIQNINGINLKIYINFIWDDVMDLIHISILRY